MAKKNQPSDPVLAAIANIEKQMGGDPKSPKLIRLGDKPEYLEAGEALSFGMPDVDSASYCGGIPRGKLVELFGEESSGKSYLTLKLIADAQKKGKVCVLFDVEQCLAEGTLIFDANKNIYRTVEEICATGEFSVLSVSSDNKLIKQKARVKPSGISKTFIICTSYGRKIRLTGNHRVLTKRGYVLVSDLSTDDIMYIPTNIPSSENLSNSSNSSDDDKYRLLGYYIGDGTHDSSTISNVDKEVIEDIRDIAKTFNCYVKINHTDIRISAINRDEYSISCSELKSLLDEGILLKDIARGYGCSLDTVRARIKSYGLDDIDYRKRSNRLRNRVIKMGNIVAKRRERNKKNNAMVWLSQFDCFHAPSQDRRLPPSLNKEQLRHVVAGIFMTDGTSVDPVKQKRCSLSFSTNSYKLAMDLQSALLRFHIVSSLSSSCKKKEQGGFYDPNYRIVVNGKSNVETFLHEFPIFGYKKDRLQKSICLMSDLSKDRLTKTHGGNLAEVEVLAIEEADKVQTYDVSVNNPLHYEQNFLSEGLFIHNSFDPDWAAANGVDVDKLIIFSDSMTAEKQLEYLYQTVKSGVFALAVFDSTAALLPKAALEGSIEDKHVAELARVMSQALPKILNACAETKTTCVFINQIREKIGVLFGNPETTPGGRALKFYAHQRLRVAHGGSVKVKEDGRDQIVGKKSYVTFVKNKTARPWGKAEFCIMFDETAMNPIVALCREAKQYGVLKKHSGELKLNKDVLGTDKLASMDEAKTYADAAHFLVVNGLVDTVAEMTLAAWQDDSGEEDLDPIIEEILNDPTIIVSPIDGSTPPVPEDLVERESENNGQEDKEGKDDEGEQSVT